MNITVLRGRLSRPPEVRTLPSGDVLVGLDVTIAAEGGARRTESVPVVWPDAPGGAYDLLPDAEVVVVGRTRRRFFRAGGATQGRTEVVADHVVPSRQAKKARQVVLAAVGELEAGL